MRSCARLCVPPLYQGHLQPTLSSPQTKSIRSSNNNLCTFFHKHFQHCFHSVVPLFFSMDSIYAYTGYHYKCLKIRTVFISHMSESFGKNCVFLTFLLLESSFTHTHIINFITQSPINRFPFTLSICLPTEQDIF